MRHSRHGDQRATDNASGSSNVYTQLTTSTTNTDSIRLWICWNARAATTVTMHCTSSRLSCAVACYTNGVNSGMVERDRLQQRAFGNDRAKQPGGMDHRGNRQGRYRTYSSATGNLRVSRAGAGSTTPGIAIVDNTGAQGASIVTSAGASASTAWAAVSAELKPSPDFELTPGARDGLPSRYYDIDIDSY